MGSAVGMSENAPCLDWCGIKCRLAGRFPLRGTEVPWGARCQTDDKIAFSSAVDELANYFDDRFNGMR
jgi:hypothetical protein